MNGRERPIRCRTGWGAFGYKCFEEFLQRRDADAHVTQKQRHRDMRQPPICLKPSGSVLPRLRRPRVRLSNEKTPRVAVFSFLHVRERTRGPVDHGVRGRMILKSAATAVLDGVIAVRSLQSPPPRPGAAGVAA